MSWPPQFTSTVKYKLEVTFINDDNEIVKKERVFEDWCIFDKDIKETLRRYYGSRYIDEHLIDIKVTTEVLYKKLSDTEPKPAEIIDMEKEIESLQKYKPHTMPTPVN